MRGLLVGPHGKRDVEDRAGEAIDRAAVVGQSRGEERREGNPDRAGSPATPSVVFAAFSDPSELAKRWGPEGFATPSLEFPALVGESYRIEMQPP